MTRNATYSRSNPHARELHHECGGRRHRTYAAGKKSASQRWRFYGENFKNFQHTEDLDTEGTFKINLGDQNLTFFQNLMTSMFDQVQILNDPEPMSAKEAGLDAIVIPKIEKYGSLPGALRSEVFRFDSLSHHHDGYRRKSTRRLDSRRIW